MYRLAEALPDIDELLRRCQAAAMICAILNEDDYMRIYSGGPVTPDIYQANLNNGCGDHAHLVFKPEGAFVWGFAHESEMSPWGTRKLWPGLFTGVPQVFAPEVANAKLAVDAAPDVTFALWRTRGDDRWRTGDPKLPPPPLRGAPDGADLLEDLAGPWPEAHVDFAEYYHGRPLDRSALNHLYALRPLNDVVLAALAPGRTVYDFRKDVTRIGYPPAP